MSFILLLLLHLLVSRNTSGLECRLCDRAINLQDCPHLVKCDSSYQECYMDQVVTDQLDVRYTGGCMTKNTCNHVLPLLVGRRRRGDLVACSRCCSSGNDCNTALCGIENATLTTSTPVVSTAPFSSAVKCKLCEGARDITECNGFVWCNNYFEDCYMEQIVRENTMTVYNGGCRAKSDCASLIGRRADLYSCSRCCRTYDFGEECNKNLCGIPQATVQLQHRPESVLKCKLCRNAIDLADCPDYALCDNITEACYTEVILTSQLTTKVNAGCRSKQSCPVNPSPFLGKRDLVACSRCCDWGDMCNKQLCGVAGGSYSTYPPPQIVTKVPHTTIVSPQTATQAGLHLTGPIEQSLTVQAGSPLKMFCGISGPGGLVYNWTKMNSCGGFYQNVTGQTLAQSKSSIGDAGTYMCTSSLSGQTLSQTFHVQVTYLPGLDTCDFDHGVLCGWEQDTGDNFDWTLQSGPTQTDDTGPDTDHTTGSGTGQYLYIESSAPRNAGEYARLVSHLLPSNTSICFEFWSFMYGDGIGNVYVYAQDSCSKTETELYYTAGDKGQNWNHVTVTVPIQSRDFRLVIKADVGPSFRGDTAIDDLLIREGKC